MPIKANEISAILKDQIKSYGKTIKTEEVGNVITVGDGIAQVSGLDNAALGELLSFPGNLYGMVLNLEEDNVGVVLMGPADNVMEGDQVKRTKTVISVPVGNELIGRVVNALGQPLDGKAMAKTAKSREVFRVAPGVMTRESVSQPLETGIIAIDSMVPIGKGQRELIIGDRQTGKTAVAVDAIINQKGKDVLCVYVAIGQKNSSVAQIVEKLRKAGAMDYTTIVAATASDPAPLQYIVPYAGVTIAEEWMEKGKDVLIVYDDLSKHAVAYRTLALLLRRPPGREAYPGDVFYLHSQLLERAARVNKANGGGSITALPIIETQAGDISAYIPTNVISITDGQIFMMTDLFNSGQRPAIDAGYSVSRVGSAAQIKAMKQVSSSLKLELAQFNEMAAFSQFGSDLDASTRRILSHGKKVLEVIKQPQYSPLSQIDQSIVLLAIQKRLTNPVPAEHITRFKNELIEYFHKDETASGLRALLVASQSFDDVLRDNIMYLIAQFVKKFVESIEGYVAANHDALPQVATPTVRPELTKVKGEAKVEKQAPELKKTQTSLPAKVAKKEVKAEKEVKVEKKIAKPVAAIKKTPTTKPSGKAKGK